MLAVGTPGDLRHAAVHRRPQAAVTRTAIPLASVLLALVLLGAAPVPHAAGPDEERRLADARVASAAALRTTETQAAALADELDALSRRAAEAQARLVQRSAALAPLLPLMQRLALYPTETLLSVPAPQDQALRGLAVLRGLAGHIGQEAASLRAEAAQAQAAAQAANAALARLHGTQAVQSAQSADLDRQLDLARAARVQADDAAAEQARRGAADAARAETLRAALVGMEAERARAEARAAADAGRAERARQDAAAAEARARQQSLARPAGPGVQEASGPLFPPAAGQVVRAWGDRTDAGPATGMTLRPPPAARVTAPCSGRVAFAGPFRTYGLLLILDCGGGYHVVLSGFERLDAPVGAVVQHGEPVGLMPGWDPRTPGARPGLYMELRREGQAVDPRPFLRAHG